MDETDKCACKRSARHRWSGVRTNRYMRSMYVGTGEWCACVRVRFDHVFVCINVL